MLLLQHNQLKKANPPWFAVFFSPCASRLRVMIEMLGIFETIPSNIVPPIFPVNSKEELGPEDCKQRSSPHGGRWPKAGLRAAFSESDLGQGTCSYFLGEARKLLLLFLSGDRVQGDSRAFLSCPACICLGESRSTIGLNYKTDLETTYFSGSHWPKGPHQLYDSSHNSQRISQKPPSPYVSFLMKLSVILCPSPCI